MSAHPACRQPSAMPFTIADADLGRQLAGGEVIEEEQRLGALDDDVVDAHGDEIDADRLVDAGLDRDLHLGADAVVGGDEDRILEARRLEVEQTAEAADLRVRSGPPRRPHERLDRVHHGVAGVDVDAGLAHRSGRCGVSVIGHPRAFGVRRVATPARGASSEIARSAGARPAQPLPAASALQSRPMRTLARMTIPNLITIFRLIIVPIVIVMIMQGRWVPAFVLFVVAGVSDGVDGFIARRFDMRSEFGAYIDPLADKALLVSIYVTLSIVGVLPSWLAIVVVSRDLMIVAARHPVLGHGPARSRSSRSSSRKLNTAAQIGFAALVLSTKAFGVDATRGRGCRHDRSSPP